MSIPMLCIDNEHSMKAHHMCVQPSRSSSSEAVAAESTMFSFSTLPFSIAVFCFLARPAAGDGLMLRLFTLFDRRLSWLVQSGGLGAIRLWPESGWSHHKL